VKLETGLLVGVVLVAIGFIASLHAFVIWKDLSFGALVPALMLRRFIPAVLAVTLGIAVIFASFFLSVLGMSRQ